MQDYGPADRHPHEEPSFGMSNECEAAGFELITERCKKLRTC